MTLPFALDPLIAEAKLRMRRRRFLLAVGALALAAAVLGGALLLRPGGGGAGELRGTATHRGFLRIPGMTRVVGYSEAGGGICESKGSLPSWCSTRRWEVRTSSFQQWILTAAIKRSAPAKQVEVPPAFELSHPGPAEVSDQVWDLPTPEREAFLHTPDFAEATDMAVYAPLPAAAINGGIAGRIPGGGSSPKNFSPSEIRFVWLSGQDLVEVNVIGANLTVAEARQIALQAGPS